MPRGRRTFTLAASAAVVTGLAVALPAATAASTAAAATTATTAGAAAAAPGAPGASSYFDLARKDCVGTAAGTGSKVWYTVADGVLSDVYEPTIDNTNVSTLQYVVTDGSTFTDLQTRDMTYTVAADPTGMSCTVTSTDAKHGFRLITTYITDPARDTVLMHTTLQDTPGSSTSLAGLHLYARLDAHVNGNGGGRDRERRRQHRRGGHLGQVTGPGDLQHEHGHRRRQPGLRGADLHGPDAVGGPGGQRRLRGHRQRRPHPARHDARADLLHLRAGRPHRRDRERNPGRAATR